MGVLIQISIDILRERGIGFSLGEIRNATNREEHTERLSGRTKRGQLMEDLSPPKE